MKNKEQALFDRGFDKTPTQGEILNTNQLLSCCKKSTFSYLDTFLPCQNNFFSDEIIAEVRFKNDRKDYFLMCHDLNIVIGDIVAVEGSPGHDIGIVTLMGNLAKRQMFTKKINQKKNDFKKIYRKAKTADILKWLSVIELEHEVYKKSKAIIREQKIQMKLNDIEFQADGSKAYFYYTAEDRVDFRELIKVLAREFKIRVEMKQIGARQESARLGGLGPCGRELCCSSWINSFSSVSTNSARTQQLLLNPQKLAGQCTKLKCCLNFELPVYAESVKKFPDQNIVLKSKKGDAIHQKSDIFKTLMWYSYRNDRSNLMALSIESVKEIIAMNKKGSFPETIEEYAKLTQGNTDSDEIVDQNEIRKLGLID